MRKILLFAVLVLSVAFSAQARDWFWSSHDSDGQIQKAIDSISPSNGYVEVTKVTADEADIPALTIDTIGSVTEAEVNTLDSSTTNNLKVMSMIRIPIPSTLVQGATYLSEALPQNFIICQGIVDLTTPATSTNSDAATLSVGLLGAADLHAGGTGGITNSTWGAVGKPELIPAIETPSTYVVATGTATRVRMVASMAITQIVGRVYLMGYQAQ